MEEEETIELLLFCPVSSSSSLVELFETILLLLTLEHPDLVPALPPVVQELKLLRPESLRLCSSGDVNSEISLGSSVLESCCFINSGFSMSRLGSSSSGLANNAELSMTINWSELGDPIMEIFCLGLGGRGGGSSNSKEPVSLASSLLKFLKSSGFSKLGSIKDSELSNNILEEESGSKSSLEVSTLASRSEEEDTWEPGSVLGWETGSTLGWATGSLRVGSKTAASARFLEEILLRSRIRFASSWVRFTETDLPVFRPRNFCHPGAAPLQTFQSINHKFKNQVINSK